MSAVRPNQIIRKAKPKPCIPKIIDEEPITSNSTPPTPTPLTLPIPLTVSIELIEAKEAELDNWMTQRNTVKSDDFRLKHEQLQNELSKLKIINIAGDIEKIQTINKRIDQLIKPITQEVFIAKTNLTRPRSDDDPTLRLLTSSREHFVSEDNCYKHVPPTLKSLNQSIKSKKGFGHSQQAPPKLVPSEWVP
jgi:hypothetical protein